MSPSAVATATTLTTQVITVDSQSVFTSCTTFTEQYHTTISATRGQTIFISPPSRSSAIRPPPSIPTTATPLPSSSWTNTWWTPSTTWLPPATSTTSSAVTLSIPTTKFFPSQPLRPTSLTTTTLTEIDIYLATASTTYSTYTLQVPDPSTATTSAIGPYISTAPDGQIVYVVPTNPNNHTYCETGSRDDWNCWSDGKKAGVILAAIIGALVLLWLLVWLLKRRNEWITHDWRWSRGVEGNVVPTVPVNGPLVPGMATPYGYGPAAVVPGGVGEHPGWGYYR